MLVNGAENVECWSLMTFTCDLSASLETEQPQICVQPHVPLSFLATKSSTTLSSIIFNVLNVSSFVYHKQIVASDMLHNSFKN